jgi:uncharacterized NAD-dependent epimerase/dehydratase family protein
MQQGQRVVILAEGDFGEIGSKTAIGVIRYGPQKVLAVIDSTRAGRNVRDWLGDGFDVPVVATLDETRAARPDALLIGIAPAGGRLPEARVWRDTIVAALDARIDVLSGLHEFLGDDPEFARAAAASGATIVDYRRPPDRLRIATGREHLPGRKVVLTVGTDCALGKMTVALELRRAAVSAGLSTSFVATGQTGMMIEGWGAAVDRIPADFVQGTTEWLVERGESMGEWVFVEGQGSLDHGAYSSVTLGLMHGSTPHAMVMVHEPGREYHHGWEGSPLHRLKPLPEFIRLHEQVAGLVAPSAVAAVALNTSALADSDARRAIADVADETGLVVDDPLRYGAERLLDAVRRRLE